MLHHSVKSVWDEIHYNIKVNLIGLFSISIEELTHLHAIRVMESFKNLKFTVLISLVLENLLDSYSFPSFSNGGLENDTEGAVAYDLLCIIGQTLFIV